MDKIMIIRAQMGHSVVEFHNGMCVCSCTVGNVISRLAAVPSLRTEDG